MDIIVIVMYIEYIKDTMKKKLSKRVIISTWQSIYNLPKNGLNNSVWL